LFFFSSRRRHTRLVSDWSSDVCSSDLSASERETLARGALATDAAMAQALAEVRVGATERQIGDRMVEIAAASGGQFKHLVLAVRSEERRVGKECRARWSQDD